MPIRPEQARALLPWVDPARLRAGWPVGLRDGALVALLAAGLSADEISGLKASAITMGRGHLRIALRRYGQAWFVILSPDLGGRLLAWLTERRLWAAPEPVFAGAEGPISPTGIYMILHRYRRDRPPHRSPSRDKE